MSVLLVATRFCRYTPSSISSKSICLGQLPKQNFIRNFNESKQAIGRVARRRTIKERIMAPTSGTPFAIGQGLLAGGSLLGLGALGYYGLGLSGKVGSLEEAHLWPQYVKERIRSTYLYFGSSVVITAASAYMAFQTPAIMNLVTRGGWMGLLLSLGAMMGTGMLCQSIEYKEGIGTKQLAWVLHSSVIGAVLAPMCYMGGPLLLRAAWLTAGVVTGLSTVAVCAPSDKFMSMGAPLAMGLGVVFASSIGTMFLPATTALGAGLYSISLYGGLLLFSGFLLYDTQRILAQAQRYPASPEVYGVRPYDPINASISIYLDTINIFVRIATILAGQGQRRK